VDITQVLTLLFGLVATVLGILLKGEYDKRIALQQQVSELRRKAYSAFNEAINDLLASTKEKAPPRRLARLPGSSWN